MRAGRVGMVFSGRDESPMTALLRADLCERFDRIVDFDLHALRQAKPLPDARALRLAAARCDVLVFVIGADVQAAFEPPQRGAAAAWRRAVDAVAAIMAGRAEAGAEVVLSTMAGAGMPAAGSPVLPWASGASRRVAALRTRESLSRLADRLQALALSSTRALAEVSTPEPAPVAMPAGMAGFTERGGRAVWAPPTPRPGAERHAAAGGGLRKPVAKRAAIKTKAGVKSAAPGKRVGAKPGRVAVAPRKTAASGKTVSAPVKRTSRSRDPVYLGFTAPTSCTPGRTFGAVFAVYVEDARASVSAKFARLGDPGSEPLLDLAPDRQSGWEIGAPVSVQLIGEHCDVTPATIEFDWNGRENLAAFSVSVRPEATDSIRLSFQVTLAGVPIAHLPVPVTVVASAAKKPASKTAASKTAARPPAVQSLDIRLPKSAFASYASKDAEAVGYCLSALSRWSPGLEIFQDCLDLTPGERFKPQLHDRIRDHERFLLFWSRSAAASTWVRWELQTALELHGLDAVVPMPLEDPALAAPPPEFADVHLRDRFMMARYALAGIRELAARPLGGA